MRQVLVHIVAAAFLTATVSAQQPAPAATPPAAPSSAPDAAKPDDAAAQGFSYHPEGRRDPFVSLLRRVGEHTAQDGRSRSLGLGGLATGEVTLRGTMQSRSGYVALVQGADSKTYIVRAGDRLLDGTVRTITPNAMVILQQVNDPLSLEKEREVRKMLRQTDEAK